MNNKGFVIKALKPLLRIKPSVCFSFVTRYRFVRIYKRNDLSALLLTPDTDKSLTNFLSPVKAGSMLCENVREKFNKP